MVDGKIKTLTYLCELTSCDLCVADNCAPAETTGKRVRVKCEQMHYWVGPEGDKGNGLFAAEFMEAGCCAATIHLETLRNRDHTPLGMWVGSKAPKNNKYTWKTAKGYTDGKPALDGVMVNGIKIGCKGTAIFGLMNEASVNEKVNMLVSEDNHTVKLKAVRDIQAGEPIVTCYWTRTVGVSMKDMYKRDYKHHCSKSKCMKLREKMNKGKL